jgi:3-methyladenine DNA glycosylase/8-oxoguanine DNA glycosylase
MRRPRRIPLCDHRDVLTAAWRLAFPLDLRLTLGPLRHGPRDPTVRFVGRDAWRATRTVVGPATVRLAVEGSALRAAAWGDGAEAALAAVPSLVGLDDRPEALKPRHRVVRQLQRHLSGLRVGRSGALFEALLPTVLEQKVTGFEAWRSYRALVLALAEPAPGPAAPPLRLPPDPQRLRTLGYAAFHRFGIERRRAEVILAAARAARQLEAAASCGAEPAYRRLAGLPGVGAWTRAEVGRTALGDPDAVSVGDYHLPSLVGWLLAGEPRADDARMLELLEPYRGQRGRVQRLLEAGGVHPPRHGPRMAPRSIATI